MKRILFILIFICCATSIVFAQQKKRMSPEEWAKRQQTFITEHAKLSPAEAEAFFPLYFEFQQNKWKINWEARKKIKKERGAKLTEEQWKEFVNVMADAKIEIAKLEKSYIEKYLKILPARKILDIQRAEDAFQREVIKNMAHGNHKRGKPQEQKLEKAD